MNRSQKLLLAALTTATLGLALTPAYPAPWGAGPGMGQGPGSGNCMGPGRRGGMGGVANVDANLAALKAQLGIAPHQDAAWNDYAGSLRGLAEQMQSQRQTRPCASLSGADHLACRNSVWQQRGADRAAVEQTANALRSQLTPQQNAVFGNWPAPMMAGRGMRGPRW
jgi:Spy/CpxP family protein refolding chaperone